MIRRRTQLLKHAIKSQAEPRIFAIERMARSDAAAVLSVRSLDANPWLIGVQNGVIDLKTGQIPARAAGRLHYKACARDF